MGVRLKTCTDCGLKKRIGHSKRRCKACRVADPDKLAKAASRVRATKGKRQGRKATRHPSLPYGEYLLTKWWRNRRLERIRVAGWQCEECGEKRALQVHHLHYRSLWREKDKDLQVLCRECHEGKHAMDIEARRHLNAIARWI